MSNVIPFDASNGMTLLISKVFNLKHFWRFSGLCTDTVRSIVLVPESVPKPHPFPSGSCVDTRCARSGASVVDVVVFKSS